MTKQEIEDGNKVMAGYLGYKYYPHTEPYLRRGEKNVGWIKPRLHPISKDFRLCRSHRDLPFYNDWNQLMRVIEKIETEGVVVSMVKDNIAIHNYSKVFASEKGSTDKLKATWRVCLIYLKRNIERTTTELVTKEKEEYESKINDAYEDGWYLS